MGIPTEKEISPKWNVSEYGPRLSFEAEEIFGFLSDPLRNSMLHAAASESHGPLARSSDPALDIAVHYIKPLRCGGRESSVVVVDLARRFDVLALAQQVGEPHLLDSLSRLHVVHCPCPEALFCTLEKLLLSVVPIALLAVYAAPMHRWHSPQGNMQVARLQELATAHGAKFYVIPPTVRLRSRPNEAYFVCESGVLEA